jgi:hypothetical protein
MSIRTDRNCLNFVIVSEQADSVEKIIAKSQSGLISECRFRGVAGPDILLDLTVYTFAGRDSSALSKHKL